MKKVLVLANYNNEKSELYLDGCRGAGLEPVLSADGADADGYGGLLLTGGVDVAPQFYIKDPEQLAKIPEKKISETYKQMNLAYDRVCLATLDSFVRTGKPVFGICRGLQVINVYFGGTLLIDIPGHRLGDTGSHSVRISADSLLSSVYPAEISVNSYHHQAIEHPGAGLRVTAVSPDGIAEAAEHAEKAVFGVQWHPERMLNGSGTEVFHLFAEMF